MNLVIFDIDGTLTETMDADADCYVRALEDVFGFREVNTDWSVYKHATDSGVLEEIHRARTGRGPTVDEVVRFRQHIMKLLTQAWYACPFAAVPGAVECLAAFSGSNEYRVALATGAWSGSARLKMSGAGMRFNDYPGASADDANEREVIIRFARERAEERYGPCERVVCIGDGVWDARACRTVGLPFIGIGAGECAMRLRAEGAACVFADFRDLDGVLRSVGQVIGAPAATRAVVRRRARHGMRMDTEFLTREQRAVAADDRGAEADI